MVALKVRWSDEHFREFVESAPDANVFVDERGKIVLVNTLAEELFGYGRQELLERPVTALIPERFHGRAPIPGTAGWSDSHRGLQRRAMGIIGLRRDGSEFPAEISLRALDTDAGTIYAAAIRDVTDHVQARDNQLQHLSELAHVSRLSTMGEMVAGLAHELNQPLYAVANYARACQELVRREPKAVAELQELTTKLLGQSERAAEIVRRLRRFVARREPRRAPIDLNTLVREVQQLMLFHTHRFAISLRLELADNLPRVFGDAILVEQILVNLVRNAFEALSEARSPNPAVVLSTGRGPNGTIEVTVTDNGPGLPAVSLDQLFEAFYTTKEQGMGLGLVISRSIAEAHGGRLVALPPAGRGAVFQLTLPSQETAGAP